MVRRRCMEARNRETDMTDHIDRAIALSYNGIDAPTVSAYGEDDFARAIVHLAEAHGVCIHEDPVLVLALAQLDLDDEVPEALYRAVAEVLVFAYWLSGKPVPPDGSPP